MMRRQHPIPLRTACTALLSGLLALGACTETTGPEREFNIVPASAEIFVGGDVQLTAFNAPSTPVWASSNSSVATVIPETGFVMGVSRGNATISAVAGGEVASIELTVLQPPSIAIAQPTVDFFMDVGGANPASQTVAVTNPGDGTLSGLFVQGITYGPNNPFGWLSVTPSGDTAPVTLTLNASGQGLPRGTYTATVQIAAPSVENSPQSLAVMLHVQAPAEIALSRAVVPMAGIPGVTINETISLTNAGDKTLDGLAVEVRDPPGLPGNWLTASLDATTAPTTVRLSAATANLPVGSYTTIVHISSSVAGVAARDVTVNLTVSPGPAITLASTTATFQANTGQNPANQSVAVTNGGGGTLSALTLGATTYGAGQPSGWLTASLTGTTAPAAVSLSVVAATLPIGTYTATVPVQSSVASNSPVNLVVTLNVGPPPVINLNPNPLVFAGWSGGTPPSLQGIQVTNSAPGAGPLPGLSYSVAYGPGASNWLGIQWQGNKTDTPTTLLVAPNTGGLPSGSYSAIITVSSSVPGVADQTVVVTYLMRAFSVDIYPNLGGCLGGACHSSQAPFVGGSVQNDCSQLQPFLIPGDGFNSRVYRKLSGLLGHGGGTFLGLATDIRLWIDRNAPCS